MKTKETAYHDLEDGLIDDTRIELKARDISASLARAAKCEIKSPVGDELKSILGKIAEYLIETEAQVTSSGNFIIYPNDFKTDFIAPEFFSEHIHTIAEMMLEYSAVAEADVLPDGSLDVLMYLAYCPNFEPDPVEADEYPPDREILDPLTTKRVPESEHQHNPAVKRTLAKNLKHISRKRRRRGNPTRLNTTRIGGEVWKR